MDDRLRAAFEGKWREVDEIDAAYARGELDDAGWHDAMAALVVSSYLAAPNPRAGSGHSGSEADGEWSRGIVMEAVDRDCDFLDVGCANGLLMESVARWGAERGLLVEPYGVEIAPELADLARRRLPQWAERIAVGNALEWVPPRRFAVVRTGLEYVPRPRRPALVAHLLDEVAGPGGRLVIGKFNELRGARSLEAEVESWGFTVSGRAEREHRCERRIVYRAFWIDRP